MEPLLLELCKQRLSSGCVQSSYLLLSPRSWDPHISVTSKSFSRDFRVQTSTHRPPLGLAHPICQRITWTQRLQKPVQLRDSAQLSHSLEIQAHRAGLKTGPLVPSPTDRGRPTLVWVCEVLRAFSSSLVMKVLSVSKKLMP